MRALRLLCNSASNVCQNEHPSRLCLDVLSNQLSALEGPIYSIAENDVCQYVYM